MIAFGASPRATQWLILGAKAAAVLQGRATVGLQDVRRLAEATIAHRLVLSFRAEAERLTPRDVVKRLVERTSSSTTHA